MLNVLVVDDSALVRSIVVKALRLSGIGLGKAHVARDGEEALSLLREQPVDVLFTDLNMPVMGGMELIRRVREDVRLEQLSVFVLSSERSQEREAALTQFNISGYLQKPFTPEAIRGLLERKETHAGSA